MHQQHVRNTLAMRQKHVSNTSTDLNHETRMRLSLHMYGCICLYIYMGIHMVACVCVCVFLCVCVYVCVYVCVCVCTYMFMYIGRASSRAWGGCCANNSGLQNYRQSGPRTPRQVGTTEILFLFFLLLLYMYTCIRTPRQAGANVFLLFFFCICTYTTNPSTGHGMRTDFLIFFYFWMGPLDAN